VISVKERADRAAAPQSATSNISHDSLRQLLYLEAVIMETLRLHPSIPINSKVTRRACTFPNGTRVPAGHIVSYSPYIFGRLESIWGPCSRTRWNRERGQKRMGGC
jgi:cytochrome P450